MVGRAHRRRAPLRAIHRKLLRDLWHVRMQLLSIAAVLAGGVMSVVSLRGTATALERSRAKYYAEARFADAFATLTRAPDEVATRLAALPGVAAVATRVVTDIRLDLPGLELPGVGRLVSLPTEGDAGDALLNRVRVVRGRGVAPGADDEVLVSGRFAEANRLRPGDSLTAVLNERRVTLRIVGVGAAPDYLFEDAGGGTFADERTFGILWAPHELAASATGLRGAFNDVAIGFAPGARTPEVLAAMDSLLAPYGGRGAVARRDQPSHRVVENEMRQLKVMAIAFPSIFVAVAAFLVGTVLARLVATEREQIAALKAFGYGNAAVALHYLAFAATAVAIGATLGVGVGVPVGGLYTGLYTEVIRIPDLRFQADWVTVTGAVVVLAAAALAGAFGAVRGVAVLPPAEALRPPAPARYRPLLLDRIGAGAVLGPAARMVLRTLERRPGRSMVGAVGVAAALALMVGGLSMYDALGRFMYVQFRVAHRETLAVRLVSPAPAHVRAAFAALPGVQRVELTRVVPVRLRHAGRYRTVGLVGLEASSTLHRLVDIRGRTHAVPPDGLVLSDTLAAALGVGVGDTLGVDLLERGESRRAVVAARLDELMYPNAYADVAALARLVGDDMVTGAYLHLDGPPSAALYARLREMPRVASVTSRAAMLDHIDRMMARSFRISTTLIVAFAAIIALGVVYNSARIALSERGRELASLRVLGFTTREVGTMLLGEQALLALVALPLGWALGQLFAGVVMESFKNEQNQFPLATHAATYVFASGVVLVASAIAGAFMYRRAARLDLVAVLKTRE